MADSNNGALGALGSAIISGAAALGSSVVSNSGSKKSQERANKYNVDFWNMQNAYNHPTQQMARLRDAGLNPNLIYGTSPTSAVGNAEGIAPAKAAEYNLQNPLASIGSISNLKNTEAQTDNLNTQNTVLANEALLKSAQRAGQLIGNSKNRLDYEIASQLKYTSIDAARQNLKNMEAQTLNYELDNQFKDRTMNYRVKQIWYGVRQAKEQFKGAQLDNALKSYEKELNDLGLTKSDPYYFRILGKGATTGFKGTGIPENFDYKKYGVPSPDDNPKY